MLAGDAAHLNNPLGGMGMNGGIHDAINLSAKLSEIWRGADSALLGRYERQRRKVAIEAVQAQALRNRQILNERDPARRRAYYDDLRVTADDPVRHKQYLIAFLDDPVTARRCSDTVAPDEDAEQCRRP